MQPNERAANDLAAALEGAGVRARVVGGGLHWQIEAGDVAQRALRIHCFWYERRAPGLALGMNAGNARVSLGAPARAYEGPEYYVQVFEHGAAVSDGRTRRETDVVAFAAGWFAGQTLDALAGFVGERRREMLALSEKLPRGLRWDIGGDPSFELWVYGDGRSCRLSRDSDEGVACGFFLGQQQVARCAGADVLGGVEAWLVAGATLSGLVAREPLTALEPHADVLEVDPARWHWLHLRDRVADEGDVLRPLHELVEALAERPRVTRFFTFSSLNRLCFSASSHYPWVDEGLPVVSPGPDRSVLVDAARCGLGDAVGQIEQRLERSGLSPIFGSRAHHLLPQLIDAFPVAAPKLVQSQQSFALVLEDGARRCKVPLGSLEEAIAAAREFIGAR